MPVLSGKNLEVTMALSNLEKQRVEKLVGGFCRTRIPPQARTQIQLNYSIRGNDVKIVESRPHWKNRDQRTETPIARIKYDPETLAWTLFWHRSNGKWVKYPDFEPSNDLKTVIEEIGRDPNHVFWD
jgi:DUF3024 family protein